MDKRRYVAGVIFDQDPVAVVMKSLETNKGKDPVLNNTFYGKLATSVAVQDDMPGALAMLIAYARADFVVPDIRNLLVHNIADQINKYRLKQKKSSVSPELLARWALNRVDLQGPLVYDHGKEKFEIKPTDRALLMKAYPVFVAAQQNKEDVRG